MDSKYSIWINSPLSYHSPKPSLRIHLSLNFSKTWNQFYMNCRNTRSLPSNSRNSPLQWLLHEKLKSHWPMSHDEIKIVKFKQELPPQWFLLLIGPDIFSVTTWIPTTDFNTATSPSPIIMIYSSPKQWTLILCWWYM